MCWLRNAYDKVIKMAEEIEEIREVAKDAPERIIDAVTDKIEVRLPTELRMRDSPLAKNVEFCTRISTTERTFAGCVASEIVEFAVEKGIVRKEEVKEKINRLGGTLPFIDKVKKNIKEAVGDYIKGYLAEFD